MKVLIKRLNDKAKMPQKSKNKDFCYDVYASSREEIIPGVFIYGIGLAFQIVRDDEIANDDSVILDIDIRPRSSVCKTGLLFSNSVATIDEGYTGEVRMVFYHVIKSLPVYEVGDRIGQMKIGITCPIEFEWAKELKETERGANGYGSTGK